MEREIQNIKEWMKDLDVKVDSLILDGCSHRGNDLAKIYRIESFAEDFRKEASTIKDSIYKLSLSFERHKTDVVKSHNAVDSTVSALKLDIDGKVNKFKIWFLTQCAILAICLAIFVVKEFVVPVVKHSPSSVSSSVQYPIIHDKPHVDIDVDEWNKINQGKK